MFDLSTLEINPTNPLGMRGLLVTAFANVCKQMWFGSSSFVSPTELKRVIGRFATRFSGWRQHDSHELLTFMLDGIHEDLNHPTGPVGEGVFGDGLNDDEIANLAWERHTTRNRSLIVDHIHGQYRSQLTCPECQKVSVVFDPFMSISLPIKRPNCARIQVIYVPYDFTAPIRRVPVYVPVKTDRIPNQVIREAIGTAPNLLIGCADYGDGVKWTVTTKAKTVYAFEIPDPSAVYIVASVRRGGKQSTAWLKDISKFFVVALPEDGATSSEIAALVEARLSAVWVVDGHETITGEVQKCLATSEPIKPQVFQFPEGAKLVAAIGRHTTTFNELKRQERPQKSTVEPHAYVAWLSVMLNAAIPFSLPRVSRDLDAFEVTGVGESTADERISLNDCFAFLSESEVLDEKNKWYCPNCRKHVCAQKIVGIWKIPEVLIIQLKRFVRVGYSVKKLDTFVNFPDLINMQEFLVGPQKDSDQRYRLYAVSNHTGGLASGHYTAHAIVQDPGGDPDQNAPWYSFNDGSAALAKPGTWHSAAAYVLFYEKVDVRGGVEDLLETGRQPD